MGIWDRECFYRAALRLSEGDDRECDCAGGDACDAGCAGDYSGVGSGRIVSCEDLGSEGRGKQSRTRTRTRTISGGFDQDTLGNLGAEGEAGITDQANNVGVGGEEANDLVLANADFTEASSKGGGGAKLLDTDGDAGFDLI